jgi:hypothetical protein
MIKEYYKDVLGVILLLSLTAALLCGAAQNDIGDGATRREIPPELPETTEDPGSDLGTINIYGGTQI